jgi:RHS repeat-associated protein
VEQFDAKGRLTSITRANGQSITLIYNNGAPVQDNAYDYLLTSVTAQDGRKLTFSYNTSLQLQSITDSTGATYTYSYDGGGRLQTVSYPGGASKTYLYDESTLVGGATRTNLLTGIIDENATRFATFSYQADSWAVATEHAVGQERHSVTYNANGTASVLTPSGGTQAMSYVSPTGEFRVSGLTESGGSVNRSHAYTFDSLGNTDVVTDANNVTTDYDFNSRSLVTQIVESANVPATKRTTQADWHVTLRVPLEQRVLNASSVLESKSTWTYNGRGQVLTATQVDIANAAKNRTATYTYCEQAGVNGGTCPTVGLLLSVDGPIAGSGDVTNFQYRQADEVTCTSAPTTCPHRRGDLWKVTNPLGQVSEILKSDGAGRVMSIKDANGVVTDLEYNLRGWLTFSKLRGADNNSEADDAITEIDYDAVGQVRKVTAPDGTFTEFVYDDAHRLSDVKDAVGNYVHFGLNNAGQRYLEETRTSGNVLKRSLSRIFDTLGQVQTVADALSTPTDFTYDLNGDLNTTTDALNRVTDNDVDALGRLKQVIANVNGTTSDKATSEFTYDARDNLRTVVDPKGLTTSYTFDAVDNLTQLSSPDTGTTSYGYDLAGNRTSEIKADGVAKGYTYDGLSRLTGMTFAHSAQNVTFTYDATQADCASGETFSVGQLTKVTDASGSARFCFDQRGHRVRTVQALTSGSTLTVGTTYNGADRLVAMTYPSGAIVTYGRDANGRVTSIALNGQTPLVSNATYLPFGPLNTLTFGNNRVLTKTYDQNYGIDSVIDSAASNPLSEDFTLNAVGSVTGLSENTGAPTPVTRTFTYDGLDRLTAQKNGATTVEGFAYNSTGDRTSKTVGSATSYTYATTSHHLSAVGNTSRTYLPAGETLSVGSGKSVQNFAYDDNHRLSTFKIKTTLKLTNQYNGLGQRVAKISATSGNSRQFVYDEGGHLLGEYTTTGTRVREYVWMDDTLVAVLGSYGTSTYQFVETDHLGTARAVVSPVNNTIIWRWDMNNTAFGEHLPNANPDGDSLTYELNLRYPGQYYDSESGLNYNYFRDYDPVTGRYLESDPSGQSAGPSTYSYVAASPLRGVDPMGLTVLTVDEKGSFMGEIGTQSFYAFPGDKFPAPPRNRAAATTIIKYLIDAKCKHIPSATDPHWELESVPSICIMFEIYKRAALYNGHEDADEQQHIDDYRLSAKNDDWAGVANRAERGAIEASCFGDTEAECKRAAQNFMIDQLAPFVGNAVIESGKRDLRGEHDRPAIRR